MRVSHIVTLVGLAPEAIRALNSQLHSRVVANQGWSLQSDTCPANSKSCGGSACCPSSTYCQATGNGEVVACCPSASNCRGSVEGSPSCADLAWSLWTGQYGNGFCCQVGQIGAFRYGDATAGSCGSSVPAGYSSAQLATIGTGGSPGPTTTSTVTSTPSTTLTTITTTGTTTSKSTTTSAQGSSPTGKKVFAHYMVGSMTQAEAVKDVQDAKKAGFDGFALNTHTITDPWATDAIGWLFDAGDANDFNLFISFDVSWGIYQVADIPAFLAKYTGHKSYYKVNGNPFVSTFWGGKKSSDEWNNSFRKPLQSNYGITPFFVPSFDDMDNYPSGLVSKFGTVIDGAFSWESAWPAPGNSEADVSSATDENVMQQLGLKPYMMPLSPFQFKYSSDGKWYRTGEINLPMRMEQILKLQPQFVEFLTWNDAGESHYVGNIFPEAIDGNADIHKYTDGFDHTGWQQLLTPFIKAYTSGATSASQILPPGTTPVGTLWYRTQMTSSSCTDGQFQNHGQAQDAVNFSVLLPSAGYTIKVYSNGNLIGTFTGQTGLNYKSVTGLQAGGNQRIEVYDASNNKVASATGTKDVQASSSGCNWNYEVVGLSS